MSGHLESHVLFLTSSLTTEFVIARDFVHKSGERDVGVPLMTDELSVRSRLSSCGPGVSPAMRTYLTKLFTAPESEATTAAFNTLTAQEKLVLRALMQSLLEGTGGGW